MAKRVLLTGGTGFVGANLARRLLHDGHEVHLAVRAGYQGWRLADCLSDVRIHTVELASSEAADALAGAVQPEWVFHLAAHGAYSSQTNVQAIVHTNFVATVSLLEACARAGFDAFVHTGSSSEYGFKDHAPAEDEWVDPNSAYAVTKAAATQYCRFVARQRGLPVTTLRLYSVYGPYEEPTRLIPTLIVRGLDGALPPLVNPAIARDFVYADDVVEACMLAAAHPAAQAGAVYNVGSGQQTTIGEAVEIARRVLGIAAQPEWGAMPDRAWDTGVWVANSTAIRASLGWQPRVGFAEGFARTAAWLREDAARLAYYRQHRQLPA